MVSKKSKRLKGTMVGRLKAAIGIIKCGSDELQRRLCAQVREHREAGPSGAAEIAYRKRAEKAETEARGFKKELDALRAEVRSLRGELEEERTRRYEDVDEMRRADPSSPVIRMETEVETLRSGRGGNNLPPCYREEPSLEAEPRRTRGQHGGGFHPPPRWWSGQGGRGRINPLLWGCFLSWSRP